VRRASTSNLFDDYVLVRVDAYLARDAQRALGYLLRAHLRVFEQGARRRERVRAARADGEHAAVGRDHVAVAGEEERALLVGDDEHRFEVAQNFVRAPLLAQLDGRAFEVPVVLFELALEAREQREGVRARAREARENLLVVEATDFARAALHDGVAVRHLTVARERDAPVAAYEQDGGASESVFGRLIVNLYFKAL
jgi:hypothetical protein